MENINARAELSGIHTMLLTRRAILDILKLPLPQLPLDKDPVPDLEAGYLGPPTPAGARILPRQLREKSPLPNLMKLSVPHLWCLSPSSPFNKNSVKSVPQDATDLWCLLSNFPSADSASLLLGYKCPLSLLCSELNPICLPYCDSLDTHYSGPAWSLLYGFISSRTFIS